MGGKIYSIAFYNFGLGAISTGLVQRYAIHLIGYKAMFGLLSALSGCSLLICLSCFTESSKWTALTDDRSTAKG
jgi:hypothetical protein